MNRFSFSLFALLLLAMSFQACRKDSTEVEPDRVFAQYELIYDQFNNQTTAEVRFRVGNETGRTIILEGGANVTLNGQRLEPAGGRYSRVFQGLVDSVTFVFTDNLDRVYSNTLAGLYYMDMPSYLVSFTRGQSMEFVWDGDPLFSPERAVLHIENDAEGVSNEVELIESRNGSNSFFVDGNRLFDLEPVNSRATLSRELFLTGEGTPVGATKRIAYSSRRDILIY